MAPESDRAPSGRRLKPWPRPQALLLDAMGTLIGLRRPVGETYAEHAAGHGIHVDADAISRTLLPVLRQAPPLAFPGLQGEALLVAEQDWWGDRIDTVLRITAGAEAPTALRRELFEHYADPAVWRVYSDVPERLQRWQAAGLRLAVVSNFDSRLHGILDGLDLSPWLDQVIISSTVGAAKPSPLPFRRALEGLGLQPHQAWHVGDSPEDGDGARAAGLRCLIVRRP